MQKTTHLGYRPPLGSVMRAAALFFALLTTGCGSLQPTNNQTLRTVAHQNVYVAVGASDAFGIGTDDPDRESWPTMLSELLRPPVRLVNLGIPGETVGRARANELPIALDAHPQFVTIWLGVNDFGGGVTLNAYRQQLMSLVSALRQGSQALIVVGNLPDLALLPAFSQFDATALTAQVRQWNAAIASVCTLEHVGLVDVFAGWSELADHPEYISADGLHPSALGAERLAQLFNSALQQQTAQQP